MECGKTSLIKVYIYSDINEFEKLKEELLKNPHIKEVGLDRVVYKKYKQINKGDKGFYITSTP